MKIALLLLYIVTASAYKVCPGVYVNLKYYDKHIIKESLNNVRDMIYNRNNNSIYFTIEANTKEPTRKLAYINLKDKSTGFIEGVINVRSLAIDPDLNRLFVGSSDGLYIINLNKNKTIEKLPINDDIRSIFVKKNVIYFVNNEKKAYKYDFHSVTHVSELRKHGVDKLVLDDDNNIIFLHNRTPYRVKLGTNLVVQISHDDVVATDIAVDKNYYAYISALDGLYVYSKDRYVLDRIGELNDIQKLAIVDVDPIYIEHDTLIRLVNNPRLCLGGPYWE